MTQPDGRPWYLDPDGWLMSASGAKLARIGPGGELWLYDKRAGRELCLTLAELARLIDQAKRRRAA